MSDGEKDTGRRVNKAKEVFDKYGNEIRAVIEFNVKDRHTVEDIFQDFFVYVVENPIPQDVEDVRSYIYKAVVNDAIDRKRRARIRRRGDKKYAESISDNAVKREPQTVAIMAEELERVFRLIESSLPPRHVRAVMEYYGFGQTISGMSSKLKIEERSASRYLSEAIRAIRYLVLQSEGAPG